MALKKSTLLWMMILVLLAVIPAARAELSYLPDSSYYHGQTHYYVNLGNGEILSGHIEFAVYDTLVYPDEYTGNAPGEGRYIYAYQIFNDSGSYNAALSYFAIKEIGDGAIPSDNPNENIGTDDSPFGVDSTDEYFSIDLTEGIWEFADGLIEAGDNSMFLLVRSDGKIKKGSYDLLPPEEGELPVPGEGDDGDMPVPEPATCILLTLGGLLSLRKFG